MKNIFVLLGLICSIALSAQDMPAELYDKKLIVKKFYVTFLGKSQAYYDKDATENLIDNSNISFEYRADGSYSIFRDDTLDAEGVWRLSPKKDSIYINDAVAKISQLDAGNLVYRTYSLQFADTSARVDTMFTYIHLIPAPIVTSVDDQQSLSAMTLFPNPVKNTLTIQVPAFAAQGSTVRMVNVYGQVVREESVSSSTAVSLHWDVQSMQKGMYYMQILVEGGKRYSQVLIKE